jgi:cation diffusion facilitator CzcD-associated flavoprotein CzcO
MDPITPIRRPLRIAIIGAGPAGLACARWLLRHGLNPVLFDAADRLGGQWNVDGPHSGVWRGMRTNTSRVLSAFSDLPHEQDTAVYPRQDQMLAYLERYAALHGIGARLRTGTRVEHLSRVDGGWQLRLRTAATGLVTEVFDHVIVATGRQSTPAIPPLPGLDAPGDLEVLHAQDFAGGEAYRGRDVVVAGGSVSALEIASDLALSGARRVILSSRRQRYVLPKLIGGVPTDHVMFTRAAALAGSALPPDAIRAQLRALFARTGADPRPYGAQPAHADPFVAGLTQSQYFLSLVAEGRIETRPFVTAVEDGRVQFADGSDARADVLLLATGYRLHLPFLDEAVARTLDSDEQSAGLHEHTFHPELPGLAFAGLFDQTGPLLPVLELQARWIAGVVAGRLAPPAQDAMQASLARHRATRTQPQGVLMHDMAMRFATLAGVLPSLASWPRLERALLFGPLTPAMFRLQGPDALDDAPARVLDDAAAFGAIESSQLTADEKALRAALGLEPREAVERVAIGA